MSRTTIEKIEGIVSTAKNGIKSCFVIKGITIIKDDPIS
jgi:hypothetical protein